VWVSRFALFARSISLAHLVIHKSRHQFIFQLGNGQPCSLLGNTLAADDTVAKRLPLGFLFPLRSAVERADVDAPQFLGKVALSRLGERILRRAKRGAFLMKQEQNERVKKIEWNNVSLVVEVAIIMSVAISRDSSRVSRLHQGSFASLAHLPRPIQILGDAVNQIVGLRLAQLPPLLRQSSLLHCSALETSVGVLDDSNRRSLAATAPRLALQKGRLDLRQLHFRLLLGFLHRKHAKIFVIRWVLLHGEHARPNELIRLEELSEIFVSLV